MSSTVIIDLSSNNVEGTSTEAAVPTSFSTQTPSSSVVPPATAATFSSTHLDVAPGPSTDGDAATVNRPRRRYAGATCVNRVASVLYLFYCLVMFLTMLTNATLPLLRNEVFLGFLGLLVFLGSFGVSMFCWLKVYMTPPGPLKPFMSGKSVEGYVKAVIRRVCIQELGPDLKKRKDGNGMAPVAAGAEAEAEAEAEAAGMPVAATDNHDGEDADEDMDERIRVNEVVASRSREAPASVVARSSETSTATESSNDDDEEEGEEAAQAAAADPVAAAQAAQAEKRRREKEERKAARRAEKLLRTAAEDTEGGTHGASGAMADPAVRAAKERKEMSRRRRRRERLGLPVHSLATIAMNGYDALSRGSDVATRREAVSFLLGHSQYCQYCSAYEVCTIRHCKYCGHCSMGQDQHCFLLGSCIAHDNHKYMVLLMFYTAIYAVCNAATSLYVVLRGYNYFFHYDDVNVIFYTAFCFSVSNSILLLPLMFQHLYVIVGRGETTEIAMLREERAAQAERRRLDEDRAYQPVLQDEDNLPAQPKQFHWDNLKVVFGEDPRLWTWFFPTMAPVRLQEEAAKQQFRAEVERIALSRLRHSAQTTREDGIRRPSTSAVEVGVEDNANDDAAAAELVDRVTRGDPANEEVTVAVAVRDTAARTPSASLLSTADKNGASHASSPTQRPTIQRIPFFARRGSGGRGTGHSVGQTTDAGSRLHFTGPSFRTIDPLEVYNQPATTATSASAASAAAVATSVPPLAVVPVATTAASTAPPSALVGKVVSTTNGDAPTPLAPGTAERAPMPPAPSLPGKRPIPRTKTD